MDGSLLPTPHGPVWLRDSGAIENETPPLVLLHPLPHDGGFFDTITPLLARNRRVLRPDYPGFGNSPTMAAAPSIESWATALLAALDAARMPGQVDLLGFHTGCLVGPEMSMRAPERVRALVLVDVPCFDAAGRAAMLKRIEESGSYDADALTGFRAAFAWPCETRLPKVTHPALVLATDSPLREPSLAASRLIPGSRQVDLPEVSAPAFEHGAAAIASQTRTFLDRPAAG